MSVEKRITDVSEKYALMCKKANEHMKVRINPNNLVYAKLKESDDEITVHIVTEENQNSFVDPIRVFSQREIERLVFEPDKTTVQNFLDLSSWVEGIKEKEYLFIDSMEKLMLCYLMDKVYFRMWDGSAWISK
ncbi:hypothetical protein OXPF_06840 [Oxobacter pfennigii]|uniref:Uncharacterized protein n=1 Tax=Oxobacter pfennigii TaxID=36849 RepID=A0A0P8WA08_9CLOT|nr:hypothetical protein [Oxobacter pfennigii]KPU45451.1 hypothetical protein OXPF_06840 [Oxobacter pfennigii]